MNSLESVMVSFYTFGAYTVRNIRKSKRQNPVVNHYCEHAIHMFVLKIFIFKFLRES
jgi:hypothetical protein